MLIWDCAIGRLDWQPWGWNKIANTIYFAEEPDLTEITEKIGLDRLKIYFDVK